MGIRLGGTEPAEGIGHTGGAEVVGQLVPQRALGLGQGGALIARVLLVRCERPNPQGSVIRRWVS